MSYGATSTRGLGLSGVVVGSGIVEKPSADARRSEKRKTIIVLLVWNRRFPRQTKVFADAVGVCFLAVGGIWNPATANAKSRDESSNPAAERAGGRGRPANGG